MAVAASVHGLAAFPLLSAGSSAQCRRWAEDILSGSLIGGYSLSELPAGSDAAALTCRADKGPDGYRINGAEAWITHGGAADFYALFARTGPGSDGVSCFLAPGQADGLTFGRPEEKMGLHAIPTTSAF
ncbi:acyl-CoA dehydrogenase family protein [Streptomyces asiaticus]